MDSQEELVARLILNTKRNRRLNNLLEIARDIEALSEEVGGLDQVSKLIGISGHMLNQFLSVNKLSKEVREKIITRELDSVSVANYISKYTDHDQLYLADNFINGSLNSQDIRAIGPLKTRFSDKPINELAQKVVESKNIKVSVFYIQLPKIMDSKMMNDRIREIVGEENIISVETKGYLGILKLTKDGEVKLKKESKGENLKSYLKEVLNK